MIDEPEISLHTYNLASGEIIPIYKNEEDIRKKSNKNGWNDTKRYKNRSKSPCCSKTRPAFWKITEGVVQKLLTNSEFHPRGIKVMLEDGIVGRVKEIK